MDRLRHRPDFLAAASGRKAPTSSFVLQARRRGDENPPRMGFTVSKKVGSAVERNRVRRRLRALVRQVAEGRVLAGHDYVMVGRRAALSTPLARMIEELVAALGRVHGPRGAPAAAPHD
jgi:ribonuclease P protein component